MTEQARLPWGEQKTQERESQQRQPRPSRTWQIDERSRRAARKGLAEARRALESTERHPADAA